jgi:hypothetical protein
VAGAPNGVRLTMGALREPVDAEIVVAALPPGHYRVDGEVEGFDLTAGDGLHFELATDAGATAATATAANERSPLQGDFTHPGGPLVLHARLSATNSGRATSSPATTGPAIWVSSVRLTTKAAPP